MNALGIEWKHWVEGGGIEGKLSWGKGGLQGKKQGGGIEFECRQRLNVMRGGAHSL